MSTTGGTEQGTVKMLDLPDVIRKKFKTAVTDSGREVRRGPDKTGVSNLSRSCRSRQASRWRRSKRATTGRVTARSRRTWPRPCRAARADPAPLRGAPCRSGGARPPARPRRGEGTVGLEPDTRDDARAHGLRQPASLRLRPAPQPFDLGRRQRAPVARREVVHAKPGVPRPVQAPDRVADCLAHPLDLALPPLVERELEHRAARARTRPRRGSGRAPAR